MAVKVAAVLLAMASTFWLRSNVIWTAVPISAAWDWYDAASAASPTMFIVADGAVHWSWALALALQSPWHSAVAEQFSVPVHDGCVMVTLQPP
jgi:hypothetical protein